MKHVIGIICAALFFGAAIGVMAFFTVPSPVFEHEWTFVYRIAEHTPEGIVEHPDFSKDEENEKEKALIEILKKAKRKNYKEKYNETEDIKYTVYLESKEGFLIINLGENYGVLEDFPTGKGYEIINSKEIIAEIDKLLK